MNSYIRETTFPPFIFPWYIMLVFVQKLAFIRRKIHKKTAATRAALFGSNMHQIVCRLGLRPRPHWGAYSAP